MVAAHFQPANFTEWRDAARAPAAQPSAAGARSAWSSAGDTQPLLFDPEPCEPASAHAATLIPRHFLSIAQTGLAAFRCNALGAPLPNCLASCRRRAPPAGIGYGRGCGRSPFHAEGGREGHLSNARVRPISEGGERRRGALRRLVRAGASHAGSERASFSPTVSARCYGRS